MCKNSVEEKRNKEQTDVEDYGELLKQRHVVSAWQKYIASTESIN